MRIAFVTRCLVAALLLFSCGEALAQDSEPSVGKKSSTSSNTPAPPKLKSAAASKGLVYSREFFGYYFLHTASPWGLGASIGTLQTVHKTTFYQFELTEFKHPRETQREASIVTSQTSTTGRLFIYGKQNSLIALHAGLGAKYYFSEKSETKGVAVGMTYSVGPTLGIIKPYYLDIVYPSKSTGAYEVRSEGYSAANADKFLDAGSIVGPSGFTAGLDQTKFTFGGYGKAALLLDWSAYESFGFALELGAMMDVYATRVPIAVVGNTTDDNRAIYPNLYLAVHFGRRSYR